MKQLSILILLLLAFVSLAQIDPKLLQSEPSSDFDNILVEKIADDSNQTAFLIWVKKEVPLHKHLWHTENIYVIEGKGEMTLADEKFIIQKGDYINIPQNTPHALLVHSSKPIKVLSIQSPHFDGSDRIQLSTP